MPVGSLTTPPPSPDLCPVCDSPVTVATFAGTPMLWCAPCSRQWSPADIRFGFILRERQQQRPTPPPYNGPYSS